MADARNSLIELWRSYRQTLQHEHGWEVPLQCLACATVAVPVCRGWTPSRSIRFGDRSTIFANLSCPKCAAPMQRAAERALAEIFANVEIPARNRRLLKLYLAYAVIWSLILAAVVAAPLLAGWQVPPVLLGVVIAMLALLRSLGSWLNYSIASHRQHCDCGNPAYKFMGLLGRTCCYRCSSCGRLLRLRN